MTQVQYAVTGTEIEIAVPRKALGVEASRGPLRLDFKWIDNMQTPGDILDCWINGDTAPNGRFRYRYSEDGSHA
ncbi:MAG: hypothetical protein ACUVX8_09440 [Candidatus Zipacnadales bacterium]